MSFVLFAFKILTNSSRLMVTAPNEFKWGFSIWQSRKMKPDNLIQEQRYARAILDPSLILLNIDSPEKMAPETTP